MTKVTVKHNKKEEQKRLIVRVVCMALVAALVVTSVLTMFPTLFQQEQSYSIDEMLEAGIIYLAEDGNYYFTEEYLSTVEDDHDHE